MKSTALIRRETVEELCAHRARAEELYERGFELIHAARAAHAAACYGRKAHISSLPDIRYLDITGDKLIPNIIADMDRDMWKSIINGTPIGSLMDKAEREEFEKSLELTPPPATVENISATLERLLADSDTIFRRGLINAFQNLCRDYKSNDGFKIGDRIIINYGVVYDKLMDWFRFSYRSEAEFQDVDRVMHVLDGKPAPEYQQGLCAALRQGMEDFSKTGVTEVETPYWRARFFKKGTVHLYPLRRDLRDKANKIIAEHFGEVLPAGHGVHNSAPDYQGRTDQEFNEDFFASTPAVVEQLLGLADLDSSHIVLEPSAGEGAIALPVSEIVAKVICVEKNATRANALKALLGDGVICADFLKMTGDRMYDRIIMNPPFSDRQDVRHVLHALKFLKPDGLLLAVMGSSAQSRSDKLTEHLRGVIKHRGGWFIPLPANSFKASGTAVSAVIAYIPGEE